MKQQRFLRHSILIALALTGLSASIGCPPANDPQDSETKTETSSDRSTPAGDENSAANSPEQEANSTVSEPDGPAQTGTTGPSSAGDGQEKFRVDANLFEGWAEPEFAFFVTGRQMGYIEPCGCTGLANQKGGLMRRHTFFQQLVDKGWELIPIDAGNQIRRFGLQPVIKFNRTFETLAQKMDYQAIAFGPDDLRLDAIEILQTVLNYQQEVSPFISANADVLEGQFETFRILQVGDQKIGITAILGDQHHSSINNNDVVLSKVDEALPKVINQLKEANCDIHVLLSHDSITSSQDIAERYPFFDLIVCAGGDGEPTKDPTEIKVGEHTTQMILTGYKGMHVGVVGFFPGSESPFRYQRVPLDDRFEDSSEVMEIFKAYQQQLKTVGLSGLDIREVAHPSGQQYAGSVSCGDCHTTAFDIWENGVDGKGGPHAHATTSLVEPGERTWVQRHFDPECLSCHVTGWNPQKYYPYESGYLDLDASAHLHGNGCENCHGPGAEHVAAESGEIEADDDRLEELREMLRVTKEQAKEQLCITCHDLDNSPDFHLEGAWEKYWPQIEHYGVD